MGSDGKESFSPLPDMSTAAPPPSSTEHRRSEGELSPGALNRGTKGLSAERRSRRIVWTASYQRYVGEAAWPRHPRDPRRSATPAWTNHARRTPLRSQTRQPDSGSIAEPRPVLFDSQQSISLFSLLSPLFLWPRWTSAFVHRVRRGSRARDL
jgi:hypothetical protein